MTIRSIKQKAPWTESYVNASQAPLIVFDRYPIPD
jgi:hypothetical protein